MSQAVECTCCVPGCDTRVTLMTMRLSCGPLDVTEGLCAHHLGMAAHDRLTVFKAARLGIVASQGLEEIILFVRAWEALKLSAIERAGGRAA